MKVFVNNFFFLFILLFGMMSAFAGTAPASGPPAPTGKGAAVPPPPPGLPIDDYAYILMVIAVLYGFYILCYRQIKTKPSI